MVRVGLSPYPKFYICIHLTNFKFSATLKGMFTFFPFQNGQPNRQGLIEISKYEQITAQQMPQKFP